MTKTQFSTWVGSTLLASSVLLLPGAPSTFAQTATSPSVTRPMDTPVEHDTSGLWGLWGVLGLAGLLGLRGVRRRHGDVGTSTNPRERTRM